MLPDARAYRTGPARVARPMQVSTLGHGRLWGFCDRTIRPLIAGARVAGTAVTLALPCPDSMLLHRSLDLLRPGDVSASMVSLRGRLQKEGAVIHVIVDRVIPRDDMLRSVGRMELPVTLGRGDGATHAGVPDRGEARWRPGPRDLYSAPFPNGADPEDLIKVRSHDFH